MTQKKVCLASDNWTPAHPLIIKAITEVNIKSTPGLSLSYPVETNQIFFTAPASWIPLIQEKIFCYPWDAEKNEVRFIAFWNTSEQDVKEIRSILSEISKHSK